MHTSYERVKAILEHKEPDRIPFDLGGSVLTGMNKNAYIKLRKYLKAPVDAGTIVYMRIIANCNENRSKLLVFPNEEQSYFAMSIE